MYNSLNIKKVVELCFLSKICLKNSERKKVLQELQAIIIAN